MRFTALFPLACAIAAFVLSLLCLLAGSKPGMLEDYAIVTLNTSTLGHNLLDEATSPSSTSSAPSSTPTSVGSFLTGLIHNATDSIIDDFNEIGNDIADKLAAELGISQWYSLHLMDMCEGSYSPNATHKGASKNITSCTNKTAMYHFDPAAAIDEQLHVGKVQLNLSDINWPDELTDGIKALNGLPSATFVLYCIGIAACGLAILTALVAFVLHGSRLVSLGNAGLTILAFFALGIASAIVTVVMVKVVNLVNKYGDDIGLFAYRGNKYLAMTWAATALMFIATIAWVGECCVGRRNKNKEWAEKTTGTRRGIRGRF